MHIMTRKKLINKPLRIGKSSLLLVIAIGFIGASIFGNNIGNAMAENNLYVGRHAGFNVSVDEAIRDALKHVPYMKKPYPQFKVIEIRVSKGSTIPKHTVVVLELAEDKI
jgi:hypothetical protein